MHCIALPAWPYVLPCFSSLPSSLQPPQSRRPGRGAEDQSYEGSELHRGTMAFNHELSQICSHNQRVDPIYSHDFPIKPMVKPPFPVDMSHKTHGKTHGMNGASITFVVMRGLFPAFSQPFWGLLVPFPTTSRLDVACPRGDQVYPPELTGLLRKICVPKLSWGAAKWSTNPQVHWELTPRIDG